MDIDTFASYRTGKAVAKSGSLIVSDVQIKTFVTLNSINLVTAIMVFYRLLDL